MRSKAAGVLGLIAMALWSACASSDGGPSTDGSIPPDGGLAADGPPTDAATSPDLPRPVDVAGGADAAGTADGIFDGGPGADASAMDVAADGLVDAHAADALVTGTPDSSPPDAAMSGPDPRCAGAAPATMTGAGTKADPYLLCLAGHLSLLGVAPHTLDRSFALGDDLDVSGLAPALATIGQDANPLAGSFDGRGRGITGLAATLFHTVGAGAEVSNLRLAGAGDASQKPTRWGLLATTNRGTVTNVHVSGTFSLPAHAGLLIGANEGMVEASSASGAITQGAAHVGGLVGVNLGTIRRSWSTVSVTASSRVGGLVGRQSAPGAIVESYALGPATGNLSVGGLVGTLFGGEIRNSYARSTMVTGPEAGGLVGIISGSATDGISRTIASCYAASVLSGEGAEGLVGMVENDPMYAVASSFFLDTAPGTIGTRLSAEQMKQQESYPGWDFARIWQLAPAVSPFPSLRFQP